VPNAGKPEIEGQKVPKAAGGVPDFIDSRRQAPVEIKNSSTTPNPLLSQNQLPDNVPETILDRVTYAREVFRQTAANLGFPQDTLSLALLVFARYFSLPIKPALIGQLRREILNTGKTSSPETAEGKAALDSETLATVIASDKGVILNREALSRYASFLLPPVFDDEKEKPNDKEQAPGGEELQAIAEEQGQTYDLLSFFNSIPGKNGQYWMVFPFNIKVKGTELNVFLRILKKEFSSAKGDEELIVDISGPKRQWRCFVRKNTGKFRADIQVYPECSPKELGILQKEAERFIDNFEEIQIRNGDKVPSWAEDLSTLCLPSINKNV